MSNWQHRDEAIDMMDRSVVGVLRDCLDLVARWLPTSRLTPKQVVKVCMPWLRPHLACFSPRLRV
eukprot:2911434-Amphidinium_carterae.1